MSQDSNDSNNQNDSANATPGNGSQMSFKDWKMHKDIIDSKNEPQKRKPDKSRKNYDRFNKTTLPSLLSLNFDQNALCSSGQPSSFMSFGPYDGFNNPNFNRVDQYGGNGYSSGMNFNSQNSGMHSGANCNGQNFNNGVYRGGGYRNAGYNQSIPDNFFNTDGFYSQKDMIEETIADNPFRQNSRAQQLLNETKHVKNQTLSEKKKPAANKPMPADRKENDKTATTSETSTTPPMTEPKIFIKNPRKESNKPYIPMPKPPETEITGTLEERKQQWKDYREAMKPFKNREFYNAKRVVQRLGKKDPRELDEKDQFRLSNAQEKMAQHKQKLSEKYDHYIQSPDNTPTSNSGELFVLKRGNQSPWSSASKPNPVQFQNYGNFGESLSTNSANVFGHGFSSSSGRKILGGPSKYSTFVSGGSLESTLTTQY